MPPTFSVTFGSVALQQVEYLSGNFGILHSDEILLSKKRGTRTSDELHPTFRFSCITGEAGHISTLRGMVGGKYPLVIVESPDLHGIAGMYANCSIADLVPMNWGLDSAKYEIEFVQDTR
jgi:hypothetical protein